VLVLLSVVSMLLLLLLRIEDRIVTWALRLIRTI
jgi:hypothetical protein